MKLCAQPAGGLDQRIHQPLAPDISLFGRKNTAQDRRTDLRLPLENLCLVQPGNAEPEFALPDQVPSQFVGLFVRKGQFEHPGLAKFRIDSGLGKF